MGHTSPHDKGFRSYSHLTASSRHRRMLLGNDAADNLGQPRQTRNRRNGE
jgi:hypothetical protein